MRKVLALILMLLLICTTVSAEYRASGPYAASSTVDDLRVRSTPNGEIVGYIHRADEISVLMEDDGWAYIRVLTPETSRNEFWPGMEGWVSLNYLEKKSIQEPQSVSQTTYADTPSRFAGYDEILSWYQGWISGGHSEPLADGLDASFFVDGYADGSLLRDLDENGVDELLILSAQDLQIEMYAGQVPCAAVIELFTLQDGQPLCLLRSNQNKQYFLREDGKLYGQQERADGYTDLFLVCVHGNEVREELQPNRPPESLQPWMAPVLRFEEVTELIPFESTNKASSPQPIEESRAGSKDMRCTTNNLRVRTEPKTGDIVGHLEQADRFRVVDEKDGWALIEVTFSAASSPDSWEGLSGWVSMDYLAGGTAVQPSVPQTNGYDDVIKTFCRWYGNPGGCQSEILDAGFDNYLFMDGDLNRAGYILRDLDGNGTEELLIFSDHEVIRGDGYALYPTVAAVYTLADGQPLLLLSSTTRDDHVLLADGSFFNEGSSGAVNQTAFLKTVQGTQVIENGYISNESIDPAKEDLSWYSGTSADLWNFSSERYVPAKEAERFIADMHASRAESFPGFVSFRAYQEQNP